MKGFILAELCVFTSERMLNWSAVDWHCSTFSSTLAVLPFSVVQGHVHLFVMQYQFNVQFLCLLVFSNITSHAFLIQGILNVCQIFHDLNYLLEQRKTLLKSKLLFWQALALDEIKTHHWCIVGCSAMTGENLLTGVDWLLDDIAARIYTADWEQFCFTFHLCHKL